MNIPRPSRTRYLWASPNPQTPSFVLTSPPAALWRFLTGKFRKPGGAVERNWPLSRTFTLRFTSQRRTDFKSISRRFCGHLTREAYTLTGRLFSWEMVWKMAGCQTRQGCQVGRWGGINPHCTTQVLPSTENPHCRLHKHSSLIDLGAIGP